MILRLLALVALIGVTVGLTDWLQDLQENLRRAPGPDASHAPDHTAEDIVLTMMGVDGVPSYRIKAPRMAHFVADDTAKLLAPRVWFYPDEGPPVRLRSQRARLSASGERIWLPGEVDIVRPPYADRGRIKVLTRNVTVFPNSRRARTTAPVLAASQAQRLQGVGMVLDLASGTLDFKSRVRGTYVP
jgi:lipopolysaccharide export system protein LptC